MAGDTLDPTGSFAVVGFDPAPDANAAARFVKALTAEELGPALGLARGAVRVELATEAASSSSRSSPTSCRGRRPDSEGAVRIDLAPLTIAIAELELSRTPALGLRLRSPLTRLLRLSLRGGDLETRDALSSSGPSSSSSSSSSLWLRTWVYNDGVRSGLGTRAVARAIALWGVGVEADGKGFDVNDCRRSTGRDIGAPGRR